MTLLDVVGNSAPDLRSTSLERVRRALDGETVAEILRRTWTYHRNRGLDLVRCEVNRLYPRRDGSFHLSYDLHLGGGNGTRSLPVIAEISDCDVERRRREIIKKLRKDRRRQIGDETPPDVVAAIPDLGMVLRLFGLDEKINGLGILCEPALLGRYLDLPNGGAEASASLLGHRLGERCVLRYHMDAADSRSAVIAKLYKNHSHRGAEVDRAMHALWGNGFDGSSTIRIPRPIVYIDALQASVMEDVPGVQAAGRDCTWAGRAIAKLHAVPLRVDGCHGPGKEIALLEKWTGLVSAVIPELGRKMEPALAAVRKDLSAAPAAVPCLIHRDFHEKQVIVDRTSTTMIDFDTLCMGDAALDVGNFLAHLRLAGLQSGRDPKPDETAFADGYGRAMPVSTEIYRRAASLRLACLYAFSSRWRHLSTALIQDF